MKSKVISGFLLCAMSITSVFLAPCGSVVRASSLNEDESDRVRDGEFIGFFDDEFQEEEDFQEERFGDGEDAFSDDRLVDAVVSGNYPLVKALVETEMLDVSAENSKGELPLVAAIESGHVEIATYLIGHGADINAVDVNEKEPLVCAIHGGHMKIIRNLTQRGVYISSEAYYEAVRSNNLGLVEILFEQSTGYEYREINLLCAAIRFAVESGDRSVLEYLVERKGMDVNIKCRDDNNSTLMHVAILRYHADRHENEEINRLSIIEYLLDKEADAYEKDFDGKTALQYAKEKGFDKIVDVLRMVRSREDSGVTTFQSSTKRSRPTDM